MLALALCPKDSTSDELTFEAPVKKESNGCGYFIHTIGDLQHSLSNDIVNKAPTNEEATRQESFA